MATREQQIQEVRSNSEAFAEELPRLLAQNLRGQYALMHKRKIEAILKDFDDAMVMGNKLFGDKPFSVQPIEDRPMGLGMHAHLL